MAQLKAQTLKGFRDFLPELMAPRQAMIRRIEATFERHGFQPLQTPALEYLETLMGKYGDEADKLLYRFQDHGDRRVALRYDLTVPLARVVAEHRGEIQLPFRRYQIAPVWRADKPQRGRFREFFQCDADIAGVNSAVADAEVLVTGLSVLRALGVEGAVLHLNHRDVLFGLIAAAGVTDPAQQIVCIRAIDKLDKVPPSVVQAEITEATGLSADQANHLLEPFLPATSSPTEAPSIDPDLAFAALRTRLRSHLPDPMPTPVAEALDRVEAVLALVESAGFGGRIRFDVSIARGLDYYTGIIYETRLTDPKVSSIGAVMSGGRYDGLIGLFTKEVIPAVGISLGLDRLLAALQELGLVATDSHAVQVYVTVFDPTLSGKSLEVAQKLRSAGLRVELDLAGGKLGKQLERASKRGARLAVMVGPEEAAADQAVVKDLRQGSQQTTPVAELAGLARSLLQN